MAKQRTFIEEPVAADPVRPDLLREEVQPLLDLIHAGNVFAHAAYTVSQSLEVPQHLRTTLLEKRVAWDKARQNAQAAIEKLCELPALFDPIRMGA